MPRLFLASHGCRKTAPSTCRVGCRGLARKRSREGTHGARWWHCQNSWHMAHMGAYMHLDPQSTWAALNWQFCLKETRVNAEWTRHSLPANDFHIFELLRCISVCHKKLVFRSTRRHVPIPAQALLLVANCALSSLRSYFSAFPKMCRHAIVPILGRVKHRSSKPLVDWDVMSRRRHPDDFWANYPEVVVVLVPTNLGAQETSIESHTPTLALLLAASGWAQRHGKIHEKRLLQP